MTEEEKRALLEGVRGDVFDRALGEAQHDREAATLRRERDEARAQVKAWQDEELSRRRERDEARAVVAARWALAREVEELLGIAAGPAGDDRLREGVEAVRRLRSERDVALALLVRVVKYERADRAVTPGTTRLARVCEEARALLARVGGAP